MRGGPLFFSVLTLLAVLAGGGVLFAWCSDGVRRGGLEELRLPVAVNRPPPSDAAGSGDFTGTLTTGPGAAPRPTALPLTGSWPQFRGPQRNNVAVYDQPLARQWPAGGPPPLWRIPVGEGHAGAAIHQGRVYLVDYDRERQEDAIRCLSLADGRDIWRYSYPVKVKRNHGMSRTVPAVNDQYLVTLGPKCHVHCLEALTGRLIWKHDLVREFGSVVPPWYAGQCPLIDGDLAILAPGGEPLVMALELATGREVWRTPNPGGWQMTHSSIVPAELGGVRQYLYCGSLGVVGVAAADGRTLWRWPEWKISTTVPSPVPVGSDRVFFTGGYGAGSQMVRLVAREQGFAVEELYRRPPTVFSADQQTPILYHDHLYAVLPDGRLACMDLQGTVVWTSPSGVTFGLGPLLVINDLLFVLQDQKCELVMVEASPVAYRELARAKVLGGHDAWAPMAFADGRLILRDLTEMVCLDLSAAGAVAER